VVNLGASYSFVPSNPWVAVGWRRRDEISVDLAKVFGQHGIALKPEGAKKVLPADNRIELNDGSMLDYDYLILATGPDLAFDEVPGLGPDGHTQSVCHVDHAEKAERAVEALMMSGGPAIIGAVQGASCYGPAYEFAFILETALRRKKVRDRVPMTFVTPEPYIGHLGLDGVGDTKGLLESALRERHIKWITNARVTKVEAGKMFVEEVDEAGAVKAVHELPFAFSMMLPAFRGVPAILGIDGLVNPRGFIVIDKHQRNPKFPNVFGIGVAVAIPPVGKTPLPVGVPKTGFMIESMVTATAENVAALIAGRQPAAVATWNAVCLADFGDRGIAFVAQPQIPPRNVNWSSSGKWVHAAKIGFEKYFLRKMRQGKSDTFYERLALDVLGITKLKEIHTDTAA
jgi:sulfide:quinone oxidoreductase